MERRRLAKQKWYWPEVATADGRRSAIAGAAATAACIAASYVLDAEWLLTTGASLFGDPPADGASRSIALLVDIAATGGGAWLAVRIGYALDRWMALSFLAWMVIATAMALVVSNSAGSAFMALMWAMCAWYAAHGVRGTLASGPMAKPAAAAL